MISQAHAQFNSLTTKILMSKLNKLLWIYYTLPVTSGRWCHTFVFILTILVFQNQSMVGWVSEKDALAIVAAGLYRAGACLSPNQPYYHYITASFFTDYNNELNFRQPTLPATEIASFVVKGTPRYGALCSDRSSGKLSESRRRSSSAASLRASSNRSATTALSSGFTSLIRAMNASTTAKLVTWSQTS